MLSNINNQDDEFANICLWQDTNQDGISQADELKTLTQMGIQPINLTRTGETTTFNDGVQTDGLNFNKTDGTLGKEMELFLEQNKFYSEFVATWQITTEQTDAGDSVQVYSFRGRNTVNSQALYEQAYNVLKTH